MQSLVLQAARSAIRGLVEYAPAQAENIITILLSELVAVGFLRDQLKDDFHQRLLDARYTAYRYLIPILQETVLNRQGTQAWESARAKMHELIERYNQINT